MRKFKIYNAAMTSSFDLSDGSTKVSEVSGLGNGYENITANQGGIRKWVIDKKNSLDSLTLTINFGINSNAYTNYTALMNLIQANKKQKLVLEYTVNGNTRYIDVALSKAPKSQMTGAGIITEAFEFEKLTPLYTRVQYTLASQLISNAYYENILPKIKITAATNPLTIKLRRASDNAIVQTVVINRILSSPEYIEIDSENRSIVYYDGLTVANAYNDIAFGSGKTAFIEIPSDANYYLENDQSVAMIVEYKKWVID